jgi:NAD(P)H-nitrite reductase large subunit
LVVGASLIGIKLVELFYGAGLEICLADMADHIFPQNAHPECASIIEDRLLGKGIKLRFGAVIRKIENTGSGVKAYFNDNPEAEEADLVAMCTGVKANIDFIDLRQVEVKQGILVNEQMQTNIPGLYAAGDVAQGINLLSGKPQIIGLWSNARYQGWAAGRNLAGVGELFAGNVHHSITHFLGIDFVRIGDVCEYDKMDRKYDGKIFRQLFWKDGRLTGANMVDTYCEAGIIKSAVLKGINQPVSRYGNLFPVVQNYLLRKTIAEVEEG